MFLKSRKADVYHAILSIQRPAFHPKKAAKPGLSFRETQNAEVTYHALLNAVVNKGDRASAWRIVSEMKGHLVEMTHWVGGIHLRRMWAKRVPLFT